MNGVYCACEEKAIIWQQESARLFVGGQEIPAWISWLPRGHGSLLRFYGPDDKLATKVVVSVFLRENSDPDFLKRWFSTGNEDVRQDLDIGEQILAFLKPHAPRSTVMTDGIIGCPHEEGVDYPEGRSCQQCPYWAGRDRFTHERIQ